MEHTTYASRLRYLDADDVDDAVVEYDGLDVRGPDGDKIGDVDGFIVDAQAGRVYYVVVDSGGWFSSNRLLVPVGHATLDTEGKSLDVDVSRDALMRYPQFDEDRFRQFSDDDLRDFEARMVEACCPGEPLEDVSVTTWAYDTRNHYRQPAWWGAESYPRERLRPVESPIGQVMATNATLNAARAVEASRASSMPPREQVVARAEDQDFSTTGEASPHFDGRAQPGDVLGIETGGERTRVGDTAADENRRRESALKARADDDDSPRQSER